MSANRTVVLILWICYVVGCCAGESEALLFDFESPQQAFENPERLTCVPEHATQGQKAGKVLLDKPYAPNFGFWGGSNQAGKWGEYDQLIYDVFVEGGPVKVQGWVRDKEGSDWWKRYNFEYKLQPGKRRVTFSLGALTRQNGKGLLDLKTLDFFALTFESEDAAHPATIYLDNARLVKGTGAFEVKVLYSFEGKDEGRYVLEDYPEEFKGKSSMGVVAEHATEGSKALRMDSRAPAGNVQFSGFDGDWSRYDMLAIDIFSAATQPVQISGWVRAGDPKAGWWDRHNYERMLKPGLNTVKLALGAMGSPRSPQTPIELGDIVSFCVAIDRQTVFIDNVRLIKGTEEIPVAGLKKFDFGPAQSAVMPGFTRTTRATAYDKSTGFGWLPGAQLAADFDMNQMLGRHRAPDDLCRDFSQPTRATFAVDVPNGTYGVWLMLGPPGNGWGPYFRQRTVAAEGKTVVDQRYDLETWKAHEFQFQDTEDLPGDDLWERYINVLFLPAVFDVEVTDGQLDLAFDTGGATWTSMLNGLVLWPKEQDTAARKWLNGLESLRKEQYQALHVEKLPDAPATYPATADDQAQGYVRFVHSPDRVVEVNSTPTPAEAKGKALEMFAAPGQYEDACFGLYPLKDCGSITVSVGDLVGPNGAKIPSSQLKLLVTRYKALNRTAVYVPTPKYLDRIPQEGVALKPGVTRSFWLIAHVPTDAAPGSYRGQIKLSFAGGQTDALDVALTVWPIELQEPDFPMSMFMMGPSSVYFSFDATGESYWKEWATILTDARAHGMTSADPMVGVPLQKIAEGKAQVDFGGMDRFMELARSAGFHQDVNGYSLNPGFQMKMPVDHDAVAKQFGVSDYGVLAKAYFDAVREHATAKKWLPITFCTDDEYLVHPGGDPEKLAAHHRLLQSNAAGFHFVTFDSTQMESRKDQAAVLSKMLGDIDTWGAGIHGPMEADVIHKAGRRLWLYNTGMNRFAFGAYMFFARKKYNVEGFYQWIYNGGGTYGNYYLASHNEAHYGVVYPSTRGLRTTPIWERIRAGATDHRYFETAWRLIEASDKSGKGAAEAKALSEIFEKMFSKLHFGKADADALDGEGKAENTMGADGMDLLRRQVAEGILKLRAAMK